ncbi:MAG: hypothetical protein EP298_04530 [Gammaproteobacteria bacterium]|nr:MAG: hypothetical protein EP298_04530 [Gammaproteobacteria bacterium]UTW42602.1 ester cyclase [bacterium SCSIO 12844]
MSHLAQIQQFHQELWDNQNINSIDLLFDENVLIHSPLESVCGTEKMKNIIQQWYSGFPSLKVYWDDFIEQDEKIVCRWHAKGIHEGQFLEFSPTGKNIHYSGITIYHFNEDKVVDYWAVVDMENIKNQLKS